MDGFMRSEPLLHARRLSKSFVSKSPEGFETRRWAIRDVTFAVYRGTTLGLAGVSGSGKSTLAKCLALLEPPESGGVSLEGRAPRRGEIQLIPQQPAASLNPRFSALDAVAEPLEIVRRGDRRSRCEAAIEAIAAVGLRPDAGARSVTAFSVGEQQRLAIARALIVEPRLLILDESFAGLDPDAAAQVLALLRSLERDRGVTLILISHDLELLAEVAGEIAVLAEGRLVEHRATAEVMRAPCHPETRRLVEAHREFYAGAGPS